MRARTGENGMREMSVGNQSARCMPADVQGDAISRRQACGLLAGFAAATLIGLVPGASSAQEGTPGAAGEWTFTDDAGKTLTLPQRPTRIAADLNAAAALWDFGVKVDAVAGWTVDTEAAWGNVDRATPNITVSAENSGPGLEELLKREIDLFVTITWGNNAENPYQWSFPELAAYEQTNAIVPVIGISGTGRADANMLRFAELSASLGVDAESAELAAARTTYEAKAAEFANVTAEQADLTSLFVYADGTAEYVAYPPIWADLAMYQGMGLNIMTPQDVPEGDYWLELSPEQAGLYSPDVLFQSTRQGIFTPEQLAEHPTYGALPAVQAGQIAPWNQDFIQSYQGLTAAMQVVIDALSTAKVVTP